MRESARCRMDGSVGKSRLRRILSGPMMHGSGWRIQHLVIWIESSSRTDVGYTFKDDEARIGARTGLWPWRGRVGGIGEAASGIFADTVRDLLPPGLHLPWGSQVPTGNVPLPTARCGTRGGLPSTWIWPREDGRFTDDRSSGPGRRRVYLFREAGFAVTKEHTFVQEQATRGCSLPGRRGFTLAAHDPSGTRDP